MAHKNLSLSLALATILSGSLSNFLITFANAEETFSKCIRHHDLVQLVKTEATGNEEYEPPRFRVKKADDGQSLVYWHFGERTGSFYAATFMTDGCAILTSRGKVRRFAFPRTAFNTGVFFELDKLELSN